MRSELRLRLISFARREDAVGATEFAMISPILVLLLLMGFDTGRYVLATQRIQEVADSVVEMLSQTAPAQSPLVPINKGDGVVQDDDLRFYYDSAMATYPDVLSVANSEGVNWWQLLNVQMSSILFVASPAGCTTSCTYTPKVVWTNGARTCGLAINASPDISAYNPATLPTDVYGQGSVLVVDVSYTFKPTFGAAYMPSISIERSAYMAPRNVPVVESQAATVAPECAGVPTPTP